MKKLLIQGLALLTALALTACSGGATKDTTSVATDKVNETTAKPEVSEEPETSKEDAGDSQTSDGGPYKIGVLAPAVTHGWVAGVTYHAEKRLKELGDEVEYKVSTSKNAEEMTTQLDDLKTWGAQAIVAFPQWEGMESPIQEAIDEGITVVNFDIEINADGVYRVAGDNKDMGIQSAKYIVDKVGADSHVIILDVPESGSVAALRKEGFLETIKDIAPDMVTEEYATKFTREDGLKDFADILTKHDKIDAVFSMDDETSIGVLTAIREAGREDIKVITGGGGAQEYFQMMGENGDIYLASALYSPAMVEEAVNNALKVLKGETVEENMIIPTAIVDRDNAADYLDEKSPY